MQRRELVALASGVALGGIPTRGALFAAALPSAAGRLSWHPEPYPLPSDAIFLDRTGARQRLVDRCGEHVLIVNLWATWCAPCVLELPELVSLQQRMGRQAAVLAIALEDDPAAITGFLKRRRLTVLDANHDPGMALYRYVGARGIPTSLVIDRRGREVARVTGPVSWTGPDLVQRLQAIARG